MITIEILKRPTAKDVRDINILLPQIAQKPHFLSLGELKRITKQGDHCNVVIARAKVGKERPIVGMATVTLTDVPTGRVAMVEDVIIDEAFRGYGLGRKLIDKLIFIADKKKAKHISLYTNVARIAANAMYQKMGFFKKEANYYRINLLLPKPNTKKEITRVLAGRNRYRDYNEKKSS